MKSLFTSICLLFLLLGCAKTQHEMQLSGNIKGLKKGVVLLQKVVDTNFVTVDSVTINGDSNFSFSDAVESPEIYFLQLKIENESLKDKNLSFFAEPGEITINTSLENFATAAVVSGSKNQEKLSEYKKLIQRYSDKNLDLIEEEISAIQQQNDSLLQAIQQKRKNTIRGKYLATVNFAINNKEYELAPYLMLSEVYDANIKYLDTVYKSLTPKIKDSKYGKALESYIVERKNEGN
ncbi:uncharacterized protein DUF4369 [Ulvibacter sp. MAR_2010_11]|uniref:DUF4369 domain-containing protein n=1 Tax=Ulvibacter sp. MAR_2010_11 TaxID=1250229 RepID=UPI000C2C8CED|nr:DUF4369 domain-containing protein [Ulvibacter sp. MAR_2010_11]PKA83681.1 uncharacterized protein DUF4369 [Ulvibacter sp. MAR_2010_11]